MRSKTNTSEQDLFVSPLLLTAFKKYRWVAIRKMIYSGIGVFLSYVHEKTRHRNCHLALHYHAHRLSTSLLILIRI
jgi:hypothetical protein